ncbi:hypothetical protein C0W54_13530 [Photobacterium kishitanii]|nr:hypothetical protein C0W54_13530 [Photobacterium kishitanii]
MAASNDTLLSLLYENFANAIMMELFYALNFAYEVVLFSKWIRFIKFLSSTTELMFAELIWGGGSYLVRL